ncbi:hypothetical protein ACTQ43_15490, partial [Segatella copri]|uniref:hypothetical protein n=1 Tax=Segatella copri TaxID=165179 RepID=UPI003F96305D
EREDVAGDAIALPEFWSASGACALKGWLECLRNKIAIVWSPGGRLYGYSFKISEIAKGFLFFNIVPQIGNYSAPLWA